MAVSQSIGRQESKIVLFGLNQFAAVVPGSWLAVDL